MSSSPIARPSNQTDEKVVLITGITKGLGRALALELAGRGYSIVGCGRDREKLLALQSELGGGDKHFMKAADVASESSVKEFAEAVLEMKGIPDILVNNAGVINNGAKMWEISSVDFDAVIDINVKGTAYVLKYFLPHMVSRNSGVVVNMSSGWGRTAAPEFSPYCASKFAVEGLTKAVAKEVPQGISIVALDPGPINTDMLAICFGATAAMYPTAEAWAPQAATIILGVTSEDNGASLKV